MTGDGKVKLIGFSGLAIFVSCIILLTRSCEEKARQEIPTITNYNNVQAVFMHQPGHYSIMYFDEKTKGLVTKDNKDRNGIISINPNIFPDVREGEPMWAVLTEYKLDLNAGRSTLDIHIHSAKDVNGAGWNHGKFGSGQTTKVE